MRIHKNNKTISIWEHKNGKLPLKNILHSVTHFHLKEHFAIPTTIFHDNFISVWDASSNLPNGILSGNLYDLGQFDQCLSIRESGFDGGISGKYCLGTVSVSNDNDVYSALLRIVGNITKNVSGVFIYINTL